MSTEILSEEREFRSKKILTELLDVQIDINERLKEENTKYSEQQKKFLALITKKERQIEDLKVNFRKNGKPLFILLNDLSNKIKKNVFIIFQKQILSFYQKKTLERLTNKIFIANLKDFFYRFKTCVLRRKTQENYFFLALKNMVNKFEKIDNRKFFALKKIYASSMSLIQKHLHLKFKKIAAFKLFYFVEKIERIIYKKKYTKNFLFLWKSNINDKISRENKARQTLISLENFMNKKNLMKKYQFFHNLKVEMQYLSQKQICFILKINEFLSKKVIKFSIFVGFEKIKKFSHQKKHFQNIIQRMLNVSTKFSKRLSFYKFKICNEKISSLKEIFLNLEKKNSKKLFECFICLRESSFQIPYFELKSNCLNKQKNRKKIQTKKNVFTSKRNIFKKKNEKKHLIKTKLIFHENAMQEFFFSRKKELETYCTTIMNIMKESQINLEKKNDENKIFLQTKKIQEENNIKLLQEIQILEKKLNEKQEALKLQSKEKEKSQEIFKKIGNYFLNNRKFICFFRRKI